MASNKIRKLFPDVRDASIAAHSGLERNAALVAGDAKKIDLKHFSAQTFLDGREALLAKQRAFIERRNAKSLAGHTRLRLNEQTGSSLQSVRDALKKPLGREHSPAWTSAGWTHGSLEIPREAAEKIALLDDLILHFGAHPAHENAAMDATAAHCVTLKNQLAAAITAEIAAQTPLVQAKRERDAAIGSLHKALMDLLRELGFLLSDTDARYYDFGFTPPGLADRPGLPLNLVAHRGHDAGTLVLDWLDASHAERYQVQTQIVGTDTDFRLADTVHDSDATLEDLPLNATVRLRVRALNEHGEGPWSAVVEVLVA